LAHTKSERLERGDGNIKRETKKQFRQDRTFTKYPARPGEEQYEWEEPRVVGDSKRARQPSSDDRQREKQSRGTSTTQNREKAKSKLGGTTDGPSSGVDAITNRVDRLRLLGNGVVPNTAERAIRILLERIHN
jgi:hypothetical protein